MTFSLDTRRRNESVKVFPQVLEFVFVGFEQLHFFNMVVVLVRRC